MILCVTALSYEKIKLCSKDLTHSQKKSAESTLPSSLGPWIKASVRKLQFILEERSLVARFLCMPLEVVFSLFSSFLLFISFPLSFFSFNCIRSWECTGTLPQISRSCPLHCLRWTQEQRWVVPLGEATPGLTAIKNRDHTEPCTS